MISQIDQRKMYMHSSSSVTPNLPTTGRKHALQMIMAKFQWCMGIWASEENWLVIKYTQVINNLEYKYFEL